MVDKVNNKQGNPLQKYFRQPKSYLKLPSRGRFWPPGSLELPENGEVAIYPMTAKDELLFKTPDALMNGQATVDVIQSCVPAIKSTWSMPVLDLDAILLAIRMATYGDKLDVKINYPNTNIQKDFTLDIRTLLADISTADYDDTFEYKNFTVKISPINYRQLSESSIRTFEEQRIFNVINDNKLEDQQKVDMFQASIKKLTELTIQLVANSVVSITVDDSTVSEYKYIFEFLEKTEKDFYKAILTHVQSQRDKFSIKPLKINSTAEDIKAGAPVSFEVPVTFDQSNFFV